MIASEHDPACRKLPREPALEHPLAGMFSYFWKFYTVYIQGLTQPQIMAKFKTKAITANGTPSTSEKPSGKRPRIAWMDDSDDENNLRSLTSKLDAQTLNSTRPSKRPKTLNANGAPGSSKQATIQEQRKQLPIAQGKLHSLYSMNP
jgi:hypothetical protein